MNEKESSHIELETFVPYKFVNIANKMSLALSSIYKNEFDLSIPEWRVMAQLAEQPNLNAKDIGLLTFMDKSKVSRAVALLEKKAYLTKLRDIEDKRSTSLVLSTKGYNLYQAIVPKALAWEKQLIDVLQPSEYRDLLKVLNKLDKHMSVTK